MLRGALVAVVSGVLVLVGCGNGTSGPGGGQGGAGGSQGGSGGSQGGSGGQGGGQGGAGGQGGSQGGAGGQAGSDGAACAQCAVPPAGSECATKEQSCLADELGCKPWRQCADACLANDFTAGCFDACKKAHPEAEALYAAVLTCICSACPAVCSPMCL